MPASPGEPTQREPPYLVGTLVVCLAITLLIDYVTPLGVAIGVLYVVPVLVAVGFTSRNRFLAVAVVATALNLLGYIISAPLQPWWLGPVNRSIATFAIWAVAFLGWSRAVAMRVAEQQRDRWRVTLAAIGDAVAVTDADGRITYLNSVAERLSGWSLQDAHEQSFEEILPLLNAETRVRVENPLRRVLAEGRTFGLANHTMLRRRDGTCLAIDDSAAPIAGADGVISGAIIVFRDVSDRYAAEARLREALEEAARRAAEAEMGRQTLEALTAYIPEGVTIADAPDARVRMISRHGLALLERDGSVLLGPADTHPTNWGIYRLDGSVPTADELPLTRAVVHGEAVNNELWLLQKPDGTRLVVSCNAGPVRDATGKITGGLIAWRDVTEQHRMQDALQRQSEALRLQDRMKDLFLSMISHELRQPLNAMRAATDLVRVYTTGDERVVRPLNTLERQVSHLSRLVDDLLDASKLTLGKFNVERTDIDFAQVVRDAGETLQATASSRGVALVMNVPAEPLILAGDAGRLRQVVSNLVTNALQHTEHGGVVTMTLERGFTEARLSVRDTGRGIAADLLPHLFDMFVQGDDAGAAGMGIGLAIAKGIVDLHDGTIVARSDGPGSGAEFEVRLPVASVTDNAVAN